MTYRELRELPMTDEQLDQDVSVIDDDQEVFMVRAWDLSENVCPGVLDDGHTVLVL